MNDIKGFLVIPSLTDNRDGITAKFGELSEVSETFSRDRRRFNSAALAPNISLQTFRIVDATGATIYPASTSVINRLLILGQWIYNQYDAAQIPSSIQASLFADSIKQEHNFTEVTVGTITQGVTTNKRLPTFVRCKFVDANVEYTAKIWISDEAFRTEYDHNQIFVIPPTKTLADLRLNVVALTSVFATSNVAEHIINNLAAVTNKYPQSAIVKFDLLWHDLSKPDATLKTTWTIITYGLGGTDVDAIKEAIRNYIAQNSSESQWNVIYPELYSENEFVIVPLWDEVAAPEAGANPILFSPTPTPTKMSDVVRSRLPAGYSPTSGAQTTFVNNNLRVLPSSYRELALLAIGNPNNSNDITDIKKIFADYTGLPSTSADFSRMEKNTRDFIVKLHYALDVAYTADQSTILPSEFTRAIRTNRLYVCFAMNGFQYMVQARSAYLQS